MPELPEVETLRRGLQTHVEGRLIRSVVIRERRLRWPVIPELEDILVGQRIHTLRRRAKYLIFECNRGSLLLHLGMSGSLHLLSQNDAPAKHEHLDIFLDNGYLLRYRDPRRFGCLLWTADPPEAHHLLATLGPEPLTDKFTAEYLQARAANRQGPVKPFLMDNRVVVGVGNIYANESLFLAGIHPARSIREINLHRYRLLVEATRATLSKAIAEGGTTLRDFADAEGRPGYFQQSLQVYGRAGQACLHCGHSIQIRVIGQRASYYCSHCQS